MAGLTRVVNVRSGEPYDVYIGRGSKWGNLWSHRPSSFPEVVQVESRERAIELYRDYLLGRPDLMADLHQLRGKVLGCYCKPAACHGDVLAELADG